MSPLAARVRARHGVVHHLSIPTPRRCAPTRGRRLASCALSAHDGVTGGRSRLLLRPRGPGRRGTRRVAVKMHCTHGRSPSSASSETCTFIASSPRHVSRRGSSWSKTRSCRCSRPKRATEVSPPGADRAGGVFAVLSLWDTGATGIRVVPNVFGHHGLTMLGSVKARQSGASGNWPRGVATSSTAGPIVAASGASRSRSKP